MKPTRLAAALLVAFVVASPAALAAAALPPALLPDPALDVMCNPALDPVFCLFFVISCRLTQLSGGVCAA